MRVLKVLLPGKIRSNDPRFDAMRAQLFRELDGMKPELTELIRARIASLFPPDHSVFVRVDFEAAKVMAQISIWVDVPEMRWPATLLARRAWELSVPVLAHAAAETFKGSVQGLELDIDRRGARVASLAPGRVWTDPAILALAVATASVASWIYLGPATSALRAMVSL